MSERLLNVLKMINGRDYEIKQLGWDIFKGDLELLEEHANFMHKLMSPDEEPIMGENVDIL